MAVNVIIKTNAKSVQKNFDRFFRRFPSITRKGLAQASFHLQVKALILTEEDLLHIQIHI